MFSSVAAGAKNIAITIEEDLQNDRLRTAVRDDGQGMDKELLAQVSDPFVTSRKTRKVGLGIPLLKVDPSLPVYVAAGLMAVGFMLIVRAARRGKDFHPQ